MTDLATIKTELAPSHLDASNALAWAQDLEIRTPTDLSLAAELILLAKTRFRALEERRTEITKPILQAKKSVDDLFKPMTKLLADIESTLKAKIGQHTTRVEQERRALMVSSAQEYAQGGTPTAIIPEPAKAEGISVRYALAYEITDPALVPRAFCMPDPVKIQAAVQAGLQIPGITVVQKEIVSARVKP